MSTTVLAIAKKFGIPIRFIKFTQFVKMVDCVDTLVTENFGADKFRFWL